MIPERIRFRRLPLALRFKIVEERGNYIACRRHLHYQIELFRLADYYVEVWRSMAINQVHWIECPSEDIVLDRYVSLREIKSKIGLP